MFTFVLSRFWLLSFGMISDKLRESSNQILKWLNISSQLFFDKGYFQCQIWIFELQNGNSSASGLHVILLPGGRDGGGVGGVVGVLPLQQDPSCWRVGAFDPWLPLGRLHLRPLLDVVDVVDVCELVAGRRPPARALHGHSQTRKALLVLLPQDGVELWVIFETLNLSHLYSGDRKLLQSIF